MRHYTDNYIINPRHKVTVNVIGAGGTGSQVLQSLARIDYALYKLGHVGLQVNVIDDDIVTSANIGRQLFSPSDVGLNKSDVLVSRINSFFGVSWESINARYGEYKERANITISCVDNVDSRISIGKILRENRYSNDEDTPYYWLDFGNQINSGQVILGTVNNIKQPNKDGVCKLLCIDEYFKDFSKTKDEDSGPSCSLAEALTKQDLFINSLLSQVGCNLLWKLISEGCTEVSGAFVNLQTLRVNPIIIK